MAVVRDRRSDGTFFGKTKPAHQTNLHNTRALVPFDQRNLGNIATRIRVDFASIRCDRHLQMIRRRLVLDHANYIGSQLGPMTSIRFQGETLSRE